jgi:hypothetical protein
VNDCMTQKPPELDSTVIVSVRSVRQSDDCFELTEVPGFEDEICSDTKTCLLEC